VTIKGGRIRVDVHNTHVSAVVAEVGVIREKLQLVFLDELSKPRDRLLQVAEKALVHVRRVDIDQRLRHLAGT